MNEFASRSEVDDLLNQLRRKIDRVEQQAAELSASIESFRSWSLLFASRVSALEGLFSSADPCEVPQSRLICGDVAAARSVPPVDCARGSSDASAGASSSCAAGHRWYVNDKVFVVRMRFSDVPEHDVIVLASSLVEVERRVADVVAQRVQRGLRLLMCHVSAARVSAVDVFVNVVAGFDNERELSPDELRGLPARVGRLVSVVG